VIAIDENFNCKIVIKNECGKEKMVDIEDCLGKPRIHLFSVGFSGSIEFPQYLLKYAGKDGRDFTTKIQSQFSLNNNPTFESLKIIDTLFNCSSTTNSRVSIIGFENIENALRQVRENDYIIIYFSGHGINYKRRDDNITYGFIPCEDFGQGLNPSLIVDVYKLLDMLDGYNCKKFLFIDACGSGQLADTIFPYSDIAFFGSSSQETNECDSIENGIFTQAFLDIIESMEGKVVKAIDLKNKLERAIQEISSKCNMDSVKPVIVLPKDMEQLPIYFQPSRRP